MSLTALAFILVFATFVCLSFLIGPIWGVMNYVFVYLISPNPMINWWAADIPDFRWSLLAALILLISMVVHKKQLADHHMMRTPVWVLLLMFFVLTLILSFSAVNPEAHFERCYHLFRFLIVYYVFVKVIKSESDVLKIILLLLVCGTLLGYFAYTTPRYGDRLEGVGPPDAADANNLAIVFAGLLPFVLPIFFQGSHLLKVIAVSATVFIVNGIVLCNSRGGMVAVAASVAFGVLLIRDRRLKQLVIVMVMLLIGAFLYLADEHFWERSQTITTSIEQDGATGRFDIWRHGLRMAADYPSGTGGGGFDALSRYYMPPELLTTGNVRSSHNTYLLILVEQGILGLLLYVFILLRLYLHLWRSFLFLNKKPKAELSMADDKQRTFRQFVLLSLIVSLVSQNLGALVSNRLYYEYFIILAALISVYSPQFIFRAVVPITEKKRRFRDG